MHVGNPYSTYEDPDYFPILTGLTEAEFTELEQSLRESFVAAIRFRKVREHDYMKWIGRVMLSIHREDWERARSVIHATMEDLWPIKVHYGRYEKAIAALTRQYVRALDAGDESAADVMRLFLDQEIESLLYLLLRWSKLEGALDFWTDGVYSEEVRIIRPFGLAMRGWICCGRGSDISHFKEPFEVELRSSVNGPGLETFVARLGEYHRFVEERIIRKEMPQYVAGDYLVMSQASIAPADPADKCFTSWGLEFARVAGLPNG